MNPLIAFVSLLFTLQSLTAFCQKKKYTPFIRNEIGTVFTLPAGNYYLQSKGIEVMYTNWQTKGRAVRVSAGFAMQEPKPWNTYSARSDTAFRNYSSYRLNYICAGGGLQFHQNLYKHLFITGALDTRFLYTNILNETSGYTMYKEGKDIGSYKASRSMHAAVFRWEFNPSVGFKFQATHFSMGVEFCSQMASMFMSSEKTGLGSQFDFNMGYNFNRICFNYRF